jgi:hypothetical protein
MKFLVDGVIGTDTDGDEKIVSGTLETLTYYVNGVEQLADLLGNEAEYIRDLGIYLISKQDYDWWADMVPKLKANDDAVERFKEVAREHGLDRDEIEDILYSLNSDYENTENATKYLNQKIEQWEQS